MTLEELILSIIQKEIILDQKTLLNRIAEQGHDIDQSTLSRIFKKLHIQKHLGKYTVMGNIFSLKINSNNYVQAIPPNLIIIKTRPGYANAFSITLDENPVEGLAGTIAGDDTIFVAVSMPEKLEKIKQEIELLLETK